MCSVRRRSWRMEEVRAAIGRLMAAVDAMERRVERVVRLLEGAGARNSANPHDGRAPASMIFRRWREIECAPRDGTAILVAEPGCGMAIVHWQSSYEHGCGWRDCYGASVHPTHWMELPPYPTLRK